jgi:hypothetical protein
MATYANRTTVSAEKSRMEIEQLLNKYGATAFMYGSNGNRAVIQFELHNRRYRLTLNLPMRDEYGSKTSYEQALRSLWRALLLTIKAILVAVEQGIMRLEEALLAHIVLPNNQTVGEWLDPQLEEAYQSGRMPPLLPAPGGR